jgi:deoxyadenosine/deoxycytidine kinase
MAGSGSDLRLDLLREYTLPIVHIRQQLYDRRLSFFFGSGIGRDLLFPVWKNLITEIAERVRALGVEPPGSYSSLTYQTQILFQKYRNKRLSEADVISLTSDEDKEATIRCEWRNLVHNVLYAKPETRDAAALDAHPYLPKLRPILKEAALIVNYNFDDVLERLIQKHREANEAQKTLGYESYWVPRTHTRLDRTPIYHPNGFLPANLQEKHSETLIFSEDEFADQLTDLSGNNYQYLFNNMTRNTCLLIGLSLDDGTLKNLLRQNAKAHPGNFHYYVRFLKQPDEISKHERKAISDANFEIYNLVTLFLTKEQLGALADLLNMAPTKNSSDPDDFEELAKHTNSKFVFYIAGCVGSGKTTLISYFRNTYVFDEWLEPRIPEIVARWDKLSEKETEVADSWILKQVSMKNANISSMKSGIYFVDRSPLDAFAFTDTAEWKVKADAIERAVCGTTPRKPLQSGHVILLQANPQEMETRMRLRGRPEIDSTYLKNQQDLLCKVYNQEGATLINTECKSPNQVARQVANLVFRGEYQRFDCDGRLTSLKATRIS